MKHKFVDLQKQTKAQNLKLTGKSGRYVLDGVAFRTLQEVSEKLESLVHLIELPLPVVIQQPEKLELVHETPTTVIGILNQDIKNLPDDDVYIDKCLDQVAELTKLSLDIAYDFDRQTGYKPCGDVLIPARHNRASKIDSHLFYSCEPCTSNLRNYAYFALVGTEWEYKGHIFREQKTGYWLDSNGCYNSVTAAIDGLDIQDKPIEVSDSDWLLLKAL